MYPKTVKIKDKIYRDTEIAAITGWPIEVVGYHIKKYLRREITAGVLLRDQRNTHKKFYISKTGRVYSYQDIAKKTGIAPSSATKRICRANNGEISEKQLFARPDAKLLARLPKENELSPRRQEAYYEVAARGRVAQEKLDREFPIENYPLLRS